MSSSTLLVEIDQSRATVTLNRPALRNAFDNAVIAELTQAFTDLGADPAVRVIVLAASGPVFCAGADLNWMKKMAGYSHAENLADAARLAAMLQAIHACPKPVIAKVQGDCYGGALGLVAACDIAVGVDHAHFCLSEVKLGLIPATIAPYVIRAMGERAARRYMLTAERFDAHEARRIGLLHETVSDAALDGLVDALAGQLINNSPHAVSEAKRLVHDVAGRPIDAGLIGDTVQRIADIRASDEGREGVAAFLQKRIPGWQGKS